MKELAKVKWFGGIQLSTGRQNNYGFLQGADGTDIYVNRNDVLPGTDMEEDAVVTLKRREGKKGPRALKVQSLEKDTKFFEEIKKTKTEVEFFAAIRALSLFPESYYHHFSFEDMLNAPEELYQYIPKRLPDGKILEEITQYVNAEVKDAATLVPKEHELLWTVFQSCFKEYEELGGQYDEQMDALYALIPNPFLNEPDFLEKLPRKYIVRTYINEFLAATTTQDKAAIVEKLRPHVQDWIETHRVPLLSYSSDIIYGTHQIDDIDEVTNFMDTTLIDRVPRECLWMLIDGIKSFSENYYPLLLNPLLDAIMRDETSEALRTAFLRLPDEVQTIEFYRYICLYRLDEFLEKTRLVPEDMRPDSQAYIILRLLSVRNGSDKEKLDALEDIRCVLKQRYHTYFHLKANLGHGALSAVLMTCPKSEVSYCEGRIWHIDNGFGIKERTAYCPKTGKKCDIHPLEPQYLNDIPYLEWSLHEIFPYCNMFEIVNRRFPELREKPFTTFTGGVFNRLEEFKDVMKCQKCHAYLEPSDKDMRFSRDFFSSFISTTASCPTHKEGHDLGIYISTCRGCHEHIIDSRHEKIRKVDPTSYRHVHNSDTDELVREGHKAYYLCLQCGTGGNNIEPGTICPNCGSTDMEQLSGKRFSCRHCGHVIVTPADRKSSSNKKSNFPMQ